MPKPEDVILKEIDKEMDKFIDKVFRLSQERLIDDGKVDTGTLVKTANINRRFLDKEIVYPASYADHVEFGRLPGSAPPTSALQLWVQRKLGISSEKEARSISFAIARDIKQRGIQPLPYLRESIQRVRGEFGI